MISWGIFETDYLNSLINNEQLPKIISFLCLGLSVIRHAVLICPSYRMYEGLVTVVFEDEQDSQRRTILTE